MIMNEVYEIPAESDRGTIIAAAGAVIGLAIGHRLASSIGEGLVGRLGAEAAFGVAGYGLGKKFGNFLNQIMEPTELAV
jgi:hypothetical protein